MINLASKPRAELLAEAQAERERQKAQPVQRDRRWMDKPRTILRKSVSADKANEYGYAGNVRG